jgi:hypothetical protein
MTMKRLVDLSISIEPELPSDPPMMIPKIAYIDHTMGAEQMKEFYPGVTKEQLPAGLGWAVEFITLTTHSGPTWTPLSLPPDDGQRTARFDR